MPAEKYGWSHQKMRAHLLRQLRDGDPCSICCEPMYRGENLHLDHDVDGVSYRGLAHAYCNTSDGARRGNAQRGAVRHAREW